MDGCIYRTKDGECDLYSEGGKFHAFCCNMNTCEGRKMTNYDRIISKTPEELADFLWGIGCNPITGNYYLNGKLLFFSGDGNGWLDWLKQEATNES